MSSQSPVLGPGGNLLSLSEYSSKLIFPVEPSIRSQVPLWMKFYCYEFMNTSTQRALAYTRSVGGAASTLGGYSTKEKMQIMIPAPTNFLTTTSHNYAAQRNQVYSTLPPGLLSTISQGIRMVPGGSQFLDMLEGMGYDINNLTEIIEGLASDYAGLGGAFSSDVNDGFMADTTYVPSGASRVFEIKISMPCLSDLDSKAAGRIIRSFEALSLPTLRSLGIPVLTKYFHPPLWVFGVGPANSMKIDPDWSGNPQLSVLRTVSHRKTAFDTNSLSAIGYGGTFKPIAYTVSLVFQELEPAFRQLAPFSSTGTNILSRSTAIVSFGGAGSASITSS